MSAEPGGRCLRYEGVFQRLRLRYFARLLECHPLPSGGRLLDYGCGPGDLLLVCRERGIAAVGADSSPRCVALARERGLEVVEANAAGLPWPPGSFDLVLLQSVIEHVQDPVALVARLRGYAKPGGLLVLSAPTPGNFFWDDPTHVRPFTPKSLELLAELCELEVIEINYVFAFLLGLRLRSSFFYRVLNLLPFAAGSNLLGVFRVP